MEIHKVLKLEVYTDKPSIVLHTQRMHTFAGNAQVNVQVIYA